MTAIDRLRAACYLEGTPPPVDQVEADLAAVEALYQAAKNVDERSAKAPWFREYYRVDALAAAVARLKENE